MHDEVLRPLLASVLVPPACLGVILMNYGGLKPHHISMCLVALNSYGNAPFEGRLLKVGASGGGGCCRCFWRGQ